MCRITDVGMCNKQYTHLIAIVLLYIDGTDFNFCVFVIVVYVGLLMDGRRGKDG